MASQEWASESRKCRGGAGQVGKRVKKGVGKRIEASKVGLGNRVKEGSVVGLVKSWPEGQRWVSDGAGQE